MVSPNLVIPPGFAQFSFFVVNGGVGHRCVWTVGGKLAGTGLSPAQGSALIVAVGNALKPIWDFNVTMTGFHALIGNDGPPMALDVTSAITGTGPTMTMLPPNVSYLIKKTTAFAGRAYRGRIYLPFIDNIGVAESGAVTGATLTKLQTASDALFAAPGTGSTTGVTGWWLLHRALPGVVAPAPTQIVSFQPELFVATQRRRLDR